MVSISAPGPSLTLFAFTHASSAETLAPSTIVSAQLMGGMPGASGRRGSQQGILHLEEIKTQHSLTVSLIQHCARTEPCMTERHRAHHTSCYPHL